MLKQPPMVVGLRQDSPELSLGSLIHLIRDDLPAVAFSDKPVTKMHDSLPMVLFRFEILVKLYETREFTWAAYFFRSVLLNEAMSHKKVDTYDRVGWFHIAYIYLINILVTYDTEPTGHGVEPFGRKNAESTDRRLLFDCKSLVHPANSIVGFVYEIKLTKEQIFLQRISTVPLEKKFDATRLHAGVNQTLGDLVKTMDINQTMKLVYVQEQIKNRRLAYGETICSCLCLTGIGITPLIFGKAVLHIVGFPAPVSPLLGDINIDQLDVFAENSCPMLCFLLRKPTFIL
jgi:hypothetical protein